MPRAVWVTTSGTTNAHPPPVLKATPIAAFRNRPSPRCGEDRGLGLAAGDVEVGRFEGGQEPHGEHRAEEHEGLGRIPPGEVMQQVLGQLRHGEDEDEVVEELER